MVARAHMINRDWYKQEREPVKAKDTLIIDTGAMMEKLKGLKEYSSVKDLAAHFNFSTDVIYDWIRLDNLKTLKVKNIHRIHKTDLAKFLIEMDAKR